MNFSQVKKWVIPEGNVSKVTVNNIVIWLAKQLEHFASTLFPFTLTSTNGENLKQYQIYGDSKQATELQLYKDTLWQDGYIDFQGSYPTTSTDFPNSKYFVIKMQAGDQIKMDVITNSGTIGRVRYIDPSTNTVLGTVASGDNGGWVTSINTESSGFKNSIFYANKDVDLGFVHATGVTNEITSLLWQNAVPRPTTPIEVESVGDKSKNLFDKTKIVFEQYMTSSGTYAKSYSGLTASDYIEVEEGKSYTVSGNAPQNNTMAFNWLDSNKAIMSVRPTKSASGYITWSSIAPIGAKYLIVNIATSSEQMGDTWQIEEGSTATPYEPYGYKVQVEVGGSIENVFNLINSEYITGFVTQYGTYPTINSTYPNAQYAYFDVKNGDMIEIVATTNNATRMRCCSITDNVIFGEITADNTAQYKALGYYEFVSGGDVSYITNCKIKILKDFRFIILSLQGTKITANITHHTTSSTTTTNVYLSEPLKRIGDYADYIDFKGQKVVRNIQEIKGSDLTFTKVTYGTNSYTTRLSNAYSENNQICVISNSFKGISYNNRTITLSNIVYIAPVGGVLSDLTTHNTDYNTVEDFNADKHKFIFDCILATPTEEPITLPSIPTVDGDTVIDVTTTLKPSKMEGDYWKA